MDNRIDNCFARLRSAQRKAFIPYICAGDPSLGDTVALALALEKSGADVIELGLPFSDPLADGVVNQLAAQRALAGGATSRGVLDCVAKIRQHSQVPIVLYTYLNPVLQFGWEEFHRAAATAGVDGLLLLDLPPEEDERLQAPVIAAEGPGSMAHALVHIRLIAPTTPPERIERIAHNARGFIYYVSREGVTGARENIASSLGEQVAQIRKYSNLPIAVGFGISTPEQAAEVAQHADAIVVGSAIVDLIAKHGSSSAEPVGRFAREIVQALART